MDQRINDTGVRIDPLPGTLSQLIRTALIPSQGCRFIVADYSAIETRVIAAETEEGKRLSTSSAQQLASTDKIAAEKTYKDPFSFTPTHSLVLYTNHLPKVGVMDAGIWRRLIVIPFEAKIQGASDVKNYADVLYEQASPAVLA